MFDLNTFAQHIFNKTSIPTGISENIFNLETVQQQNATTIGVNYDAIHSTSEADILASSASELLNPLVQLVKVTITAPLDAYPTVLHDVIKACSAYQPESNDLIHFRTFTFVRSDFSMDNGRWIAMMTWAFTFDRLF